MIQDLVHQVNDVDMSDVFLSVVDASASSYASSVLIPEGLTNALFFLLLIQNDVVAIQSCKKAFLLGNKKTEMPKRDVA